jgi:hypothetical protein
MASKKINYTSLDFDEQKTSLKTFLQGQSVFSDYDFDGSGLSILLDVLTYNTHYNAIYNNLSINEMFLDSARKRNSVVSIAKELGYRPNSAVCAKATVDIIFNSDISRTYSIPAGTSFNTVVDGTNYTFYNTSTIISTVSETSHTFTKVEIVEKSNQLQFKYTAASNVKYTIPNQYADLSTLTVSVQDNIGSANIATFTLADSIVNVTSLSNVYWIKEIDDGLYELVFGNGVIGKALDNGNVVNLNYAVSSLDAPNGARLFSYSGTLPSGVTAYVSTTSVASGGSLPEDIESIRFNAPRSYSTQNRGVTTDDYKSLIYSNFSDAKSVSVWGGEDNIPPIYGKTYICIKPKNGDILTTAQKDFILKTLLPSKNVLTISPVLVDPEYIDIILTTTVYYNELNTIRTPETIKTIVQNAILNYDSLELQKFDGLFRYSKLSKIIDTCEDSIVSNITTVTLKRAITPKYNTVAEYFINLINPIYYSGASEDIVMSSGFYIEGSTYVHFVCDDGLGSMRLFYLDENNFRNFINNSLGTVDYAKGIIKFSNLKVSSIVGNTWYLYIKPSSNDVISALTQIIQISSDDLSVNVISDKTTSGDLRGGTNYTFTTSRI